MKIHHLNCISTCPLGGRLMDGFTPSMVERGHLTAHWVGTLVASTSATFATS